MKIFAPRIARTFALALIVFGVCGARAAELRPWSGGKAPPVVLRDLSGATHDLAEYRGKVVLVNFWATWCEPCRDEMPAMQKLKERLAGRPFAVLAIDMAEAEDKVTGFLRRFPADLSILLDPDGAVARKWKVRILPTSFLIAPDGSIRYSVIGEFNWADDSVFGLVANLARAR